MYQDAHVSATRYQAESVLLMACVVALIVGFCVAGCKSIQTAAAIATVVEQSEIEKIPAKVLVKTFGVHPTVALGLVTAITTGAAIRLTQRIKGKGKQTWTTAT